MIHSFTNGAIEVKEAFHKTILYDVSNRLATAQFDGRGNISRYAVINKWDIIECFYTMVKVNGINLNYYENKEVVMIGRMQVIKFAIADKTLIIRQFLDESTNAVFSEFEAEEDVDIEIVFNLGVNYTSYLKNFFSSRLSFKTVCGLLYGYLRNTQHKGIANEENYLVVKNNITGDFFLDLALPQGSDPLEKEGSYYNQYVIKSEKSRKLQYVLSGGSRGDYTATDVGSCYENFDKHKEEALQYIAALPCPIKDSPMLEAYYKSSINCVLSMYKEVGEFKGFIAGINYQSPARTYYRDGYWTILPLMNIKPELIRNEIITLSKGINSDGRCPSAVKSNFRNWWGDHYDSPSFYVIMIFDYVRTTGDIAILSEKWNSDTVLDSAEVVIERLAKTADTTGLLVKGGSFNRRDWADNVFRSGYVTYDEILYARALQGLAYLFRLMGDNVRAEHYKAKYREVKNSINRLLWNEEKGYYYNYIDKDKQEDNLSLDTVIAVLFGIADKERSERLLKNMEQLLETRNNKEQSAGDYGVMCVYPFYKDNTDTVLKSSLPYYYHNGADWPYLSAAYAYAKLMYNMDYMYPLTRCFTYNLDKNNFTPVEFYSPIHPTGSMLQGWSGAGAFVLNNLDGKFFKVEGEK